jgi:hypothetical protein
MIPVDGCFDITSEQQIAAILNTRVICQSDLNYLKREHDGQQYELRIDADMEGRQNICLRAVSTRRT